MAQPVQTLRVKPAFSPLRFWQTWRSLRAFQTLPAADRQVVFYSEGKPYWTHLEPLVTELTTVDRIPVCYVSSDPDDPGLHQDNPRIRPFCVGDGSSCTMLFSTLQARVMVMTLPDLGTFHLRRSVTPVHYVHVFHSIVSTHMTYRATAFNHFDTLFCVGPHHVAELREAESLYGVKPRHLVEHGYGRLDRLLETPAAARAPGRRILVAPSWGPHALFEHGDAGETLIGLLLDAGFDVIVRVHPQTTRRQPKLPAHLQTRFGRHSGFQYEDDVGSEDSLHASDLMISDWSGSALEFAFAKERPVLFIDVPRKVNNPRYAEFTSVPLEVAIREQIGRVVAPSELAAVPRVIEEMLSRPDRWVPGIREARERSIYNLGCSARAGAAYIRGLL